MKSVGIGLASVRAFPTCKNNLPPALTSKVLGVNQQKREQNLLSDRKAKVEPDKHSEYPMPWCGYPDLSMSVQYYMY